MDLEDFDTINAQQTTEDAGSEPASLAAAEALRRLDQAWYTNVNRRARWMDLIGDYAGTEPFIIDG